MRFQYSGRVCRLWFLAVMSLLPACPLTHERSGRAHTHTQTYHNRTPRARTHGTHPHHAPASHSLTLDHLPVNHGFAAARAFSMKRLSRSGSLRPAPPPRRSTRPLPTARVEQLPGRCFPVSGHLPESGASRHSAADANTPRAAVQSNATPVPPPAAPTLESISTRSAIPSADNTLHLPVIPAAAAPLTDRPVQRLDDAHAACKPLGPVAAPAPHPVHRGVVLRSSLPRAVRAISPQSCDRNTPTRSSQPGSYRVIAATCAALPAAGSAQTRTRPRPRPAQRPGRRLRDSCSRRSSPTSSPDLTLRRILRASRAGRPAPRRVRLAHQRFPYQESVVPRLRIRAMSDALRMPLSATRSARRSAAIAPVPSGSADEPPWCADCGC